MALLARYRSDGHIEYTPEIPPISEGLRVYDSEIQDFVKTMIVSISGWRAVFAGDRSRESMTPHLYPPAAYAAAAAALAYVTHLRNCSRPEAILVACDTRPTGPSIVDIVVRVMDYLDVRVDLAGVIPIPEAVAACEAADHIGGLCYITASHNPAGYNGFKWTQPDGSILPQDEAEELERLFRKTIKPWEFGENLRRLVVLANPSSVGRILSRQSSVRDAARDAYSDLVVRRFSHPIPLERMRKAITRSRLTVDFNGGARSVGYDRDFLESVGVDLVSVAEKPGLIEHAIEPEGAALDTCRKLIGTSLFGYVPDNDGDRGNLVFQVPGAEPEALDGQDVFALCLLAELSWVQSTAAAGNRPVATVVNGPTSLRIEKLAERFNVRVVRAEVGEANIVACASTLRNQGWFVPIIGEGSNGGNITYPGTIRDPLATVSSLLRLFQLPDPLPGMSKTPLQIAADALGVHVPANDPAAARVALSAAMAGFSTTPVTSPDARIHVPPVPHAELKRAYERLLPDAFEQLQRDIPQLDWIRSYAVWNFEGETARNGVGNRDPQKDGTGGFAVHFLDVDQNARAFVWMRGSRTEPVFRVIADVNGTDTQAGQLLEFHKKLITRAAVDADTTRDEPAL